MNPGKFYLPRMVANISPMMNTNYLPIRGRIGLFGRIANSLRSFNWSGLLNGANKTLNVVNQTIPLVRQAGPMLNNMKSMMRIARAFGSETNRSNNQITNNNSKIVNNVNMNSNINNRTHHSNDIKNQIQKKEVSNDNYPNFFI